MNPKSTDPNINEKIYRNEDIELKQDIFINLYFTFLYFSHNSLCSYAFLFHLASPGNREEYVNLIILNLTQIFKNIL